MKTINELLEEHVTLTVESLDRLYLNGYIPQLQTPGHLVTFLREHLKNPIPSPALLGKRTARFKDAVEGFAGKLGLEVVPFARGDKKDDVSAEHRRGFSGTEGVYLVGVAQEKCTAFKGAPRRDAAKGWVDFNYSRQSAFVNHYYFYLVDEDFGPAFIKVGSYAPYPLKVCLNGHEWAKRQLEKEGIAFEALDNGVLSCEAPRRLQHLCDGLGPRQIVAFLEKWLSVLPLPLSVEDRKAGYDYRLSIWQLEASRTQVFMRPVRGREFFEEVIRENVDLGRPDRLQLVFERRLTKATPGRFRTRVIHNGVHPSLHIEYKSCRVKQYFKENRALRTETTINNAGDFGVGRDLSNLWTLRDIGASINRRLLEVQRVSQHCSLTQDTVDAITHPTVTEDGQRAPGLRFGDPRVMALLGALLLMSFLPMGYTNGSLREQVAALLGPQTTYGTTQMTYDLRRLTRKGLIERQKKTHRYRLTPLGLKAALFFTKLEARVFRVVSATMAPDDAIPRPLTLAMRKVEHAINTLVDDARLGAAA